MKQDYGRAMTIRSYRRAAMENWNACLRALALSLLAGMNGDRTGAQWYRALAQCLLLQVFVWLQRSRQVG